MEKKEKENDILGSFIQMNVEGYDKEVQDEWEKISEKDINFDDKTHDKFMNDYNVAGGFFGGRADYLIKFREYYYEILELFYKHKKYIGTDQNLFTIVGYLHPEVVNLINSGDYSFLKTYFISK